MLFHLFVQSFIFLFDLLQDSLVLVSSALMTGLHLGHLILKLLNTRPIGESFVFGVSNLLLQFIDLHAGKYQLTSNAEHSPYPSMHCFVLLDLLFEFLREYIVIERVGLRGFIAVAFLQFAVRLIFVQLLLENLQARLQLCVQEGERFDLLSIASQVLIFPIDVLLRKKQNASSSDRCEGRALLGTVGF